MQSARPWSPARRYRRGPVSLLRSTRCARIMVLTAAGIVVPFGAARILTGGHGLFPDGPEGWAFAVLTGIVVGHLVALGRERWWGGSGSGAALTLAVLLLYGWVPAVLVSLALVTMTGAVRRGRWLHAAVYGACDVLGVGAGALVLAAWGTYPSVAEPWLPESWEPATLPELLLIACAYLVVNRVLLWWCMAPPGALPALARTALLRQCMVAVALLAIAPLIVVVAVHMPVLLPLFAVPLIALDSMLWIARARAEEQLLDPLTGLPNRQWLLARVRAALEDADRCGTRCALILIDLDRFRSVNDTLGHLTGDRLLLHVSDRLQRALPREAETARLGGDEFAVLLPEVASVTAAQRTARELVGALGAPLELDGLTLVIEASAGVAVHPDHAPQRASHGGGRADGFLGLLGEPGGVAPADPAWPGAGEPGGVAPGASGSGAAVSEAAAGTGADARGADGVPGGTRAGGGRTVPPPASDRGLERRGTPAAVPRPAAQSSQTAEPVPPGPVPPGPVPSGPTAWAPPRRGVSEQAAPGAGRSAPVAPGQRGAGRWGAGRREGARPGSRWGPSWVRHRAPGGAPGVDDDGSRDREPVREAEALLRRADVAMYEAKRGRVQVAVYDSTRDGNTPGRLALLGDLRRALETSEVRLHYQPKVRFNGTVAGLEALIRWDHPKRGRVAPDEFIAIAETSGLMPRLTEFVLEAALGQVARWRAAGIMVPVAVNVSPRDVHTPGFAGAVAARLARHGVPPGSLQLEITEHVMLEDPQQAADTLAGLTGHGVRMSLDDFGTGYSSLVHLRRLPVSELKIDRSFVARLLENSEDAEIIRCTVELAHSLGLVVVAEGVEDTETWDRLRQLGCDAVQGWLVAPAMSAAETTAWLRDRGARQAGERSGEAGPVRHEVGQAPAEQVPGPAGGGPRTTG